MVDTFDFCPERYVPETLPPEATQAMSLNGWSFTSKPAIPYQRTFKLQLHGLRWYLDAGDLYDAAINPQFNAKRLEEFYQKHQTWLPFLWSHQHLGPTPLTVRFAAKLSVPAAPPRSGGWLEPLEVMLIHHDPGYA